MNAKELFLQYTDGTGDIDRLYGGPSNAQRRADILTLLAGETPGIGATKTKARWGAWGVFQKAMWVLFGAEGDCIAARDHDLMVKAAPGQPTAEERAKYLEYVGLLRDAKPPLEPSIIESWVANYRVVQAQNHK